MRRLLAVLAAVVLVGGAVLVRQRIDGDTTGDGGADRVRLLCGTDVAAACRRLADRVDGVDVSVEDEATTADRLGAQTGTDTGFDAWVTAAPWPAIVADDRSRTGSGRTAVLGQSSAVLARSPATIVAQSDRAAALGTACKGPVTWACIGGFAGRPWTEAGGKATWGTVKPGLAAPVQGAGLVALSQAVASRLGHTDWASNDLDDSAVAWFDQLVGEAKRVQVAGQTPLARFLVVPASFGAVGALEEESGPSVHEAANRKNLRVIYPEPVATADVLLTPAAGGTAAAVLDRIDRGQLLDALAATGWRVPGRDDVAGVGGGPELPATAGLPSAGALQFLRDAWDQVP